MLSNPSLKVFHFGFLTMPWILSCADIYVFVCDAYDFMDINP